MNKPGLLAALLLAPALGGGMLATQDLMAQTVTGNLPAVPPLPLAQAPTASGTAASSAAPTGSGLGVTAARGHRASVGCLINAERTADIGSPVTGLIAAIRVDRGDSVKRGQTLVVLEQGIERANLQAMAARGAMEAEVRSAVANLELARNRFERMASLQDSGAVAALSIEQARSERDVAEQRVQQARGQYRVVQQEVIVAQAQLEQRNLRAPFDGVIVERLAQDGERVEDKPVLRLAQLNPLRVELVMPAARWGSVQRGESLAVLPDLPGAGRLLAKVTHIDRTLDAASNTFRVRLALPNPELQIPAGARCKLESPSDLAPAAANPPSGQAPVTGPQISRAPLSAPSPPAPAPAAKLQPAVWSSSTLRANEEPQRVYEAAAADSLQRPRLRFTI